MALCVVIDDSEALREVSADMLRKLGHEVVEAEDAPSALSACRGGAAIALLDWDLPGLGALDFLRGVPDLPQAPVIVLCATENDQRQFQLARAVGAAHHVLKPYTTETIAAVLAGAGVEPDSKVA